MAEHTLNILAPSVNNLTARIFVRAAGLDFEEVDVYGQTLEPEYIAKYPAHLTPTLEAEGLPRGTLGESCAIMAYLSNKHGLVDLYPTDPAERAMVDNAMFYLIGTLYPLVARATYPTLGFPQYAGEVGTAQDADDAMKAKAQQEATEALAEPLEVYNTFFLAGRPFIGGDKVSIADIRLAATLEFLRAIDYPFPQWASDYMDRVESALGDAYSEPAADVRGFVAQDLERARRFYADKLGLEPVEERPGGLLYRCAGQEFALYSSTGASSGTFTQMGWSVDDLDATMAELEARGLEFADEFGTVVVEGNYPSKGGRGERAVWFRDSEGNLLGIGQSL